MSEADIKAQEPYYPRGGPTIVQAEDLQFKTTESKRAAINSEQSMKSIYDQFLGRSNKRSRASSVAVNENVDIVAVLNKYTNYNVKVKASNNWVVSGNRTLSGKPLLCNDPHLDLQVLVTRLQMHSNSFSLHRSRRFGSWFICKVPHGTQLARPSQVNNKDSIIFLLNARFFSHVQRCSNAWHYIGPQRLHCVGDNECWCRCSRFERHS